MGNSVSDLKKQFQQLPLINVSGLISGSKSEVSRVADELGQAARDFGFFRIFGHNISQSTIEATYDSAKRFFALPDEDKQKYYIGKSLNHRGYVPFSEKGDYDDEIHRNYESFDLGLDLPPDDPDFIAGNEVLGPNVWPDVINFRESVSHYYSEISNLGRLICTALEMHLNLPAQSITGHMTKPVSQLRLLHYVRADDLAERKSVNMGAHTDYECLTLLHARNAGLQVMTQDDHWIDVPVDPDVYIVNIGDMLEAWTNGIFRSTPHRVLNLSKERFSIPHFVAANHGTIIQPFPLLLQKGAAPKYQPFQAGLHLESMLRRDFPYLRERHTRNASLANAGAGKRILNPFENRISGSKLS
jgi:isopenicillin N synthase-like dioxygenase